MRAGTPALPVGACTHHSCASKGTRRLRAAALPMRQSRHAWWPFGSFVSLRGSLFFVCFKKQNPRPERGGSRYNYECSNNLQ